MPKRAGNRKRAGVNDILALSLLILLGYISGRAMEFFELPAFRELKENFIFITI